MARFVDTSVWLLAVGDEHPDREVCRTFLERSMAHSQRLHISVEVVQEFVFHRLRRGERGVAVAQAQQVRKSAWVHPFDEATLELALDLMATTNLRGRDAVHAAAARLAGCAEMVSLDADFEDIPGLRLVHPAEAH